MSQYMGAKDVFSEWVTVNIYCLTKYICNGFHFQSRQRLFKIQNILKVGILTRAQQQMLESSSTTLCMVYENTKA